ncbi:MAG: winged helix-turn-helix domain-containing protein, partial [Myxococcales bacterium]|nr:winged helix-turn-helix domain-containing protein [Myxococcales bacterium]
YAMISGLDAEQPDWEGATDARMATFAKGYWTSYCAMRSQVSLAEGGQLELTPGYENDLPIRVVSTLHELTVRSVNAAPSDDLSSRDTAALALIDQVDQVGFRTGAARLAESLSIALYCEGRSRDTILRLADRLAAWGAEFPSQRFLILGQFFSAIAQNQPPAPSWLQAMANRTAEAPRESRWSRALLSASNTLLGASLNALDRSLIASFQKWHPSWRIRPGDCGYGEEPAWGLDVPRQILWRSDGSEVDLGSAPLLWALVLSVFQGVGDKEGLQAVWGETDYHPLKHDNRLRLSIRKLRELVEPDPSKPIYLLTTEDGYSLGGRCVALVPVDTDNS